jgi:hypothetical protein
MQGTKDVVLEDLTPKIDPDAIEVRESLLNQFNLT